MDHALSQGLSGLEFGLHQVHLHFPQAIEKDKILHTPVGSWPAFELKLYPLGATRDIATSQTWAGAQTMVGGEEGSRAPGVAIRPRYIQALAAVTYELLGGTLSPVALRGGGAASDALHAALHALRGRERNAQAGARSRRDPFLPSGNSARLWASSTGSRCAAPRVQGAHASALSSQPAAGQIDRPAPLVKPAPAPVPVTTPLTPTAPPRRGPPIALIGGLAAVVVVLAIAAAFFLFLHKPKEPGGGPSDPGTGATNVITRHRGRLHEPGRPPDNPAARHSRAEHPATGHTTSGPSRQDLLKSAAIAKAQEYEDKGDWDNSLNVWLQVAKDYPEFPVGKTHLETFLNHLRDRPSPISFDEFKGMRDQITASAQMGILSAMLLLGDNLRKPEPKAAFQWFSPLPWREK